MTVASTRPAPVVDETIARLLADGGEIGVQVCAYLDGELVVDSWGGIADVASGRPVTGDTLFHVFSVTKAVAATALNIQVDRGLIGYDTRVAEIWPEYGCNGKEATTVRHVLTHRAGVPQMPEGVTPEKMADPAWMAAALAALTPLAPPGEKALYLSMTFGWLVSELVRRSDPAGRDIATFVREEIATPIGAPDLWIGLPDAELPRLARLVNALPDMPASSRPPLYEASMPQQVDLVPDVFELPVVRRSPIAGVGGIFSARSCARFWAMLAQGGEIGGVRLLSRELVATFNEPRANAEEPDQVMYGHPIPLGSAGYWLGGPEAAVSPAKHRRVLCHPGAGNSIGFADPQTRLAVAITHNRMQLAMADGNHTRELADAVRLQLGID